MMKRKSAGFSIIELLVVMAILGFVLAATTDTFVNLLRSFKQQSKLAETNIEGIIGLELFRRDVENAGFGLAWVMPTTVSYNEAAASPASTFNDCSGGVNCSAPRAILNGYNGWIDTGTGFANSAYVVIKATNVSRNSSAQLWTYMTSSGVQTWPTPTGVPSTSENLQNSDYVITLSPGLGNGDTRTLENTGDTLLNVEAALPSTADLAQPKLVFGISSNPPLTAAPRMPFNRADYYILGPPNSFLPGGCAPNTGELVKAMISQTDGSRTDILPILDCVADMKVIFRLDTTGGGTINLTTDALTGMSARDIRTQLKEVRIYILAQQGQKDTNYTSPASICVGEMSGSTCVTPGHTYNFGTNINYRWKLYTIVVQPKNVRQAYGDKG